MQTEKRKLAWHTQAHTSRRKHSVEGSLQTGGSFVEIAHAVAAGFSCLVWTNTENKVSINVPACKVNNKWSWVNNWSHTSYTFSSSLCWIIEARIVVFWGTPGFLLPCRGWRCFTFPSTSYNKEPSVWDWRARPSWEELLHWCSPNSGKDNLWMRLGKIKSWDGQTMYHLLYTFITTFIMVLIQLLFFYFLNWLQNWWFCVWSLFIVTVKHMGYIVNGSLHWMVRRCRGYEVLSWVQFHWFIVRKGREVPINFFCCVHCSF